MNGRLDVESAALAARFRAVSEDEQRGLADRMVRRAISGFEPPLVVPSDNAALDALIDALDAVGEESDMFRRARAATATRYLRRRDFEEALYEALHAHPDTRQAVTEALAALR